MKTLWNPAHRREIEARILRLTPSHTPRWGVMTAPQMVAHLTDALRMATGELPIAMRRTPFRYPVIKQLLLYIVPIPKGLPTAKELQRTPKAWDVELADLRAMLESFAARDRSVPWPAHPAFGPLGARAWGVLTLRHFDHHLRQFGV
jgi:hypothetical protein